MRVFTGLAVLLAMVTASLGAHHHMLSQPPECPARIPGVALNVTFYPNEEDCSKYWECDNGNLYNGTCSDGLVWNPNVDSCDWSYNYDCPYDKKKRSVLEKDVLSCPQPSPGEFNVTFYPNEENCSLYWECDNGNLLNASCPPGLIWNNNLQVCDWPYNYDCPYDKKKRSVLEKDVPSCPQPSPGEFNVTFYPNEENCSLYWECDNGNLKNASCPPGLIWNNNLTACDWPYNYHCPYDKRGSIHPTKADKAAFVCPRVNRDNGLVRFFANEANCHKYWVCLLGIMKEGSCHGDLVWNPNLRKCDVQSNYPCKRSI